MTAARYRPDVDLSAVLLLEDLGRQLIRGPDHCARLDFWSVSAESKVRCVNSKYTTKTTGKDDILVYLTKRVEQNISRLDISVDDAQMAHLQVCRKCYAYSTGMK